MKHSFLSIITIALACVSCASSSQNVITASDEIVTSKADVKPFAALSAAGPVKVVYTPSETYEVQYSVPANFEQYLTIEVANGVLTCSLDVENVSLKFDKNSVVVNVKAPAIASYSAEASSTIDVTGPVTVDRQLTAFAIASGKIEFAADVKAAGPVTLKAASSGYVRTRSTVNARGGAIFDAASSGRVWTSNVLAEVLNVNTASSGEVRCRTFSGSKLYVDAASSGTADISLGCDEVNVRSASSASVALSGRCSTSYLDATSGSSIAAGSLTVGSGIAKASTNAVISTGSMRSRYNSTASDGAAITR